MDTQAQPHETIPAFTPVPAMGPYRVADYLKLPDEPRVEKLNRHRPCRPLVRQY